MNSTALDSSGGHVSLSQAIAAGLISTPIAGALTVTLNDPVRSAHKELVAHNFDQAPVVDGDHPVGYVLTRDLKSGRGTIKSLMKPILPHAIASASTPLEAVLPWLHSSGFLFLLEGRQVTGFVVPSDLNRQAGRSYFYLGLVELELRLAELVRLITREVDPLTCLRSSSAKAIRKRLTENTEANIEADVVAEMYLGDLFEVVGTCSDLPELVEAGSDWRSFWTPVNELRRRTAHAVRPVLEGQNDLGELLRTDQTVHALIAALPPYGPATPRVTSS